MAINHELRQLRLARGMTQEQAAEQLGVTRQALSSYETGRTRPDLDTLLRLVEVYGTDLDGIIYGQEPARRALGRIRRTSMVLLILLLGLHALSSALLWSANSYFPVPEEQVTPEMQVLLETRWRLTGGWETVDSLIPVVSLLGGILLLALLAGGKCRLPLRTKLLYLAALTGGILLVVLPFALTDPIYAPVNYLFMPLRVIVMFLFFFILDLVISRIIRRPKGDSASQ